MFKNLKNIPKANYNNSDDKKTSFSSTEKENLEIISKTVELTMNGYMYFLYGNYNTFCILGGHKLISDSEFLKGMGVLKTVEKGKIDEFLEKNENKNSFFKFLIWYLKVTKNEKGDK